MRRQQRGAALLMAMLTVTLVAGLAAAALWQQWRAIEIEAAVRARVQAQWILTGALDWGRLILREDARSGGADHLGEPWAVPLAEARLSTFLALDQGEGSPDVFLSGHITDLQSRLNVRNLQEDPAEGTPGYLAFAKLFEHLGLPPAELEALRTNVRLALDYGPQADARTVLWPQRVPQLAWLGLSPTSVQALAPFIVLLPQRTTVNLNTASPTVLYACIPSLDLAQAQQLASSRQVQHFRSVADAKRILGEQVPLYESMLGVQSRFFEIWGRLRLEQSVVEEHSVVQREGLVVRTLWRDRGPGVILGGSAE